MWRVGLHNMSGVTLETEIRKLVSKDCCEMHFHRDTSLRGGIQISSKVYSGKQFSIEDTWSVITLETKFGFWMFPV